MKEYRKKWCLSHPGDVNKRVRKWEQTHLETARKRKREWNLKHPAEMAETKKRFALTHPGYDKKYSKTEKGKETKGKASRVMKAKRRQLGFIPLNKPFRNSVGHHVDTERVIYMPNKLHCSISHNVFTGKNMDKINKIAFNYV